MKLRQKIVDQKEVINYLEKGAYILEAMRNKVMDKFYHSQVSPEAQDMVGVDSCREVRNMVHKRYPHLDLSFQAKVYDGKILV